MKTIEQLKAELAKLVDEYDIIDFFDDLKCDTTKGKAVVIYAIEGLAYPSLGVYSSMEIAEFVQDEHPDIEYVLYVIECDVKSIERFVNA